MPIIMYLVYSMTCEYMLGQFCPNANSNACLRAGGLRTEGLPAEAVKHEWLGMYDDCRECMIVYSWGFLLNRLVSGLWGVTFLFRLSRTRPFEIGALLCSSVSVTTHEVTWGTHVVSPFHHRVLCDLEDRRRKTEISWFVFSRLYYVNLTTMITDMLSFFQVAGVCVLLFLWFCCVCWRMTDVWLT